MVNRILNIPGAGRITIEPTIVTGKYGQTWPYWKVTYTNNVSKVMDNPVGTYLANKDIDDTLALEVDAMGRAYRHLTFCGQRGVDSGYDPSAIEDYTVEVQEWIVEHWPAIERAYDLTITGLEL